MNDLPNGRVLVVEDDPAICRLITEIVEEQTPLSVVCAQSDRQAYATIPSLPRFKAIILDINLGRGTTGFDVARFARPVIPAAAVIYVTGEATDQTFRAMGVPDSGFLEKPFTPDELIDALRLRVSA